MSTRYFPPDERKADSVAPLDFRGSPEAPIEAFKRCKRTLLQVAKDIATQSVPDLRLEGLKAAVDNLLESMRAGPHMAYQFCNKIRQALDDFRERRQQRRFEQYLLNDPVLQAVEELFSTQEWIQVHVVPINRVDFENLRASLEEAARDASYANYPDTGLSLSHRTQRRLNMSNERFERLMRQKGYQPIRTL